MTDQHNNPHVNAFQDESWRVFRIMSEFVEGFERLAKISPSVSIFGSARIKPEHPLYKLTEEIAAKLAHEGFSIVSGGGPGLMEAANKGAYNQKGGLSVGLNIELPHEQKGNDYQHIAIQFHHFFARKVMFVKYCSAYIVMPGGFGTLDELAEIMTLIQTGKSYKIPVILVDSRFWQGLLEWMQERLIPLGTISPEDLQLITVVDSAEEVLHVVRTFYQGRSYHLTAEETHKQGGL